jgi:SAM-dependent methyltransferase
VTETGVGAFDQRASRYEELRPVDANWWEVLDALVRLGGLRGQRVLEIGCGTGRLSEALAQRELARVWAVDVSPPMVERAKALGVNARVARAEALPFKPGWFDAAVMRMVLHLVDRPRVLAEAARIVRPGGRVAIATEDPASFDDVWFARFFPSVPAIDRARFPAEDVLRAELRAAGFAEIKVEQLRQHRVISRAQALELIRSRAFSTFDLLPDEEYDDGLQRAEAELPERLEYRFDWLIAGATRG